jgi:hypothetical protein
MYRKVASSNISRLEAHAGFFRLLMKGIIKTEEAALGSSINLLFVLPKFLRCPNLHFHFMKS